MIIPGLFYYLSNKEKWLTQEVDVPQYIIDKRQLEESKRQTFKQKTQSSFANIRASIADRIKKVKSHALE